MTTRLPVPLSEQGDTEQGDRSADALDPELVDAGDGTHDLEGIPQRVQRHGQKVRTERRAREPSVPVAMALTPERRRDEGRPGGMPSRSEETADE